MSTTLITKRQAGAMVGLHPGHCMRLAREGRFPHPVKITETKSGGVRFVREEVQAWIEEKLAARPGHESDPESAT